MLCEEIPANNDRIISTVDDMEHMTVNVWLPTYRCTVREPSMSIRCPVTDDAKTKDFTRVYGHRAGMGWQHVCAMSEMPDLLSTRALTSVPFRIS